MTRPDGGAREFRESDRLAARLARLSEAAWRDLDWWSELRYRLGWTGAASVPLCLGLAGWGWVPAAIAVAAAGIAALCASILALRIENRLCAVSRELRALPLGTAARTDDRLDRIESRWPGGRP